MARIKHYHVPQGIHLEKPHRFEGNTIPSKSKTSCIHCGLVADHQVHNSQRKFRRPEISKKNWARILKRKAKIYG